MKSIYRITRNLIHIPFLCPLSFDSLVLL